MKIMSKLVGHSYFGIHINNATVTDCGIVIFFKLMPQSLTTTLDFKKIIDYDIKLFKNHNVAVTDCDI